MGRGLNDWRAGLRRNIGVLLLIKLCALVLLKWMFFSAGERVTPSPDLLDAHMALQQAPAHQQELVSD